MRNRFVMIMIMSFFPLLSNEQDVSLSDFYMHNTLVINPSFAGCNDALSATVTYRKQWVGFKGAPETMILSLHSPFRNNRTGMGMVINRSSVGIYKTTSFSGSYAYRLNMNESVLALGLGFGIVSYAIAWNDLNAADPGDEELMNTAQTALLPDFSFGAYFYNDRFFTGISVPGFLTHEKNSGKYVVRNDPSGYSYLISGGYFIDILPKLRLLPSVLLKYKPDYSIQADLNTMFVFKEKVWIGMGYRTSDMLLTMFQCQLNNQLRMAYSYDLDLGAMGKTNKGSHEVGLNYIFSYTRRVAGPRQF